MNYSNTITTSFSTTNNQPSNIIFHIKPHFNQSHQIDQENFTMATVIFVVFVSFGCVFLGFTVFALFCIVKKSKCSKTANKSELVHVDEHLKVSKNAVQGPNGMKVVSITMDDDLHVNEQEECRKNEKFGKDIHQTPFDEIHA
ncbi:hypothetical protein L6452_08749 [Arctium lappa]|uniref:Uncharacterized protein n=1 Tax=Arctium lappa TaxID=4217 RepID=A0ACB9DJ92_ARCLA|nr:hypothetical protein L6452_08749 [Arctium lappa]